MQSIYYRFRIQNHWRLDQTLILLLLLLLLLLFGLQGSFCKRSLKL